MFKVVTFLLFFVSALAHAEDGIGVVALVDGIVWRIPHGKMENKIQIKLNDKIFEGDQVLTETDAFIKILMRDDTVIDLGDESKFSFDQFKMGKSKEDRKAKYNFSFGKIRSIFSIKAKNEGDLQIKTPDVVMGVRGTEILADVYLSNNQFKTDITLLHGKLNVKDHSLKKNIDINPGELFKSDMFKLKNDIKQSIQKLDAGQMKQLSLGNIMQRGTFLFDITHKEKMPMHREVKNLMKEIKKDQTKQEGNSYKKSPQNQHRGELRKIEPHRPTHSPMQQKALTDEFKQKIQRQLENRPQTNTNLTQPKPGDSATTNPPPPTTDPNFSSPPPGAN